jgi:hypothetical protein
VRPSTISKAARLFSLKALFMRSSALRKFGARAIEMVANRFLKSFDPMLFGWQIAMPTSSPLVATGRARCLICGP